MDVLISSQLLNHGCIQIYLLLKLKSIVFLIFFRSDRRNHRGGGVHIIIFLQGYIPPCVNCTLLFSLNALKCFFVKSRSKIELSYFQSTEAHKQITPRSSGCLQQFYMVVNSILNASLSATSTQRTLVGKLFLAPLL